jgi:Gram-negative bacterial TonB protein C-terminal
MLQQAALDAVKSWHYRPYVVNDRPVEVDTTVNVIFALPQTPAADRQPQSTSAKHAT